MGAEQVQHGNERIMTHHHAAHFQMADESIHPYAMVRGTAEILVDRNLRRGLPDGNLRENRAGHIGEAPSTMVKQPRGNPSMALPPGEPPRLVAGCLFFPMVVGALWYWTKKRTRSVVVMLRPGSSGADEDYDRYTDYEGGKDDFDPFYAFSMDGDDRSNWNNFDKEDDSEGAFVQWVGKNPGIWQGLETVPSDVELGAEASLTPNPPTWERIEDLRVFESGPDIFHECQPSENIYDAAIDAASEACTKMSSTRYISMTI